MKKDMFRLRKDVRRMRKDIDTIKLTLEREKRIDRLIDDMKRSAREMLLMSREL